MLPLNKIAKFKKDSRDNPKLFFFTDRKKFGNIFQVIEKLPKNTAIIIREYDLDYNARLLFAKEIVKIARKKRLITLAGKSLKLHLEAKTNGVHFSDNDKLWRNYLSYKRYNSNLLLSCACHNEKTVRKARQFRINFIFFSPIFHSNSHPNSKIIGHRRLTKITKEFYRKARIYALGGIDKNNIRLLRNSKTAGIGFISLANIITNKIC